MALLLKGDEHVCAIRKWVVQEIEEAPGVAHDLGKYFFTTSTATIGALATLAKMDGSPTGNKYGVPVGIVLLFISAVLGIALSIPLPKRFDGADLMVLYEQAVGRIKTFSAGWLLFWLVGTFWALLSIL